MARLLFLLILASALCAPVALAQEEPEFDIRTPPRRGSTSETPMYRELGIGQWGVSFAVFYTARSYNISDIRKLDNSLSTSWLYSFDPWGVGMRAHIEHRLSSEWRLSLIPRADVAYGVLNNTHHDTFSYFNLPFTQNLPSAKDAQKLSLNLEFEFSARWRWLWLTAKGTSWMSFRRTELRANPSTYFDEQLGTLDRVKDRERVDWDQAYVYGLSTGVGFEFFFVDESTRFIIFVMARPFNTVQFRDASATTHGMELLLRSADFELTDHAGLYFEASMQLYLPTAEFNDIYYTQFSLGVRWR